MKTQIFQTVAHLYSKEELSPSDAALCEQALLATDRSYAVYSGFHVGAALLLDNGQTVIGCNQENAAYPSGLCAERVALFSAGAQFPEIPIQVMAIAATKGGMQTDAISPCGACRQVLIESEMRYGKPIRILLCGSNEVVEFPSAAALLPFSFVKNSLL